MDQALPLQDLAVLLVEDEFAIAELFALILEEAGAQVVSVNCGAEALKTLDSFVPNILISDIRLPDVDGHLLLAQVKAWEVEQGIPPLTAIAVTGYDWDVLEEKYQAQAMPVRFQKYLFKPVELDHLIAVVAKLKRA